MKTKDFILLEQAYTKIINEQARINVLEDPVLGPLLEGVFTDIDGDLQTWKSEYETEVTIQSNAWSALTDSAKSYVRMAFEDALDKGLIEIKSKA